MRNKTNSSKRIVVDASIASAAGESDHQLARCGRQVLEAILEICHKAYFTPELLEEWGRHRSRFSSRWLVSMKARRKYHVEEIARDHDEMSDMLSTIDDEGLQDALEKDYHLVEAAFASDSVVISYDEEAREALRVAAASVARIREIAWVNPSTAENIDAWLEAGADNSDMANW